MKPNDQKIAITEFCGWRQPFAHTSKLADWPGTLVEWSRDGVRMLSDPLADLNCMHEAENKLTEAQRHIYSDELYDIAGRYQKETELWRYLSLNAAQRAEAFLKTINKWED